MALGFGNATVVARAKAVIDVDTKGLTKGLSDAERQVQGFGKRSGTALKSAGVVAAAGLAGMAVAGKKFYDAAVEAEKSQVKLEAQLKALGISYKAHAGRIDEVIEKQSKLAALDDEELTDSFTNLVRVTGNVNEALKLNGLAADIARAKNIDLQTASTLVGKVAAGNTGVLGRYGIKIKEGATATEALGELQKKFAGQAKAYGESNAGAQERMQVATENLMEALGKGLLPIVERVAGWLSQLAGWAEKNAGTFKLLAAAAAAFLGALVAMGAIVKVIEIVKGFAAAMSVLNAVMAMNPVLLIVTALVALGVALVVAYKKSETFRNVVQAVFKTVGAATRVVWNVIKAAFDWIRDHWKLLAAIIGGPVVAFFLFRDKVKNALGAVRDFIVTTFNRIRDFISGLPERFANGASAIAKAILRPFGTGWGLVKTITGKFVDALNWIRDNAERAWNRAKSWGSQIIEGIKSGLSGLGAAIWNAMKGALDWVKDKLGSIDILPGIDVPGIPFMASGGFVPQVPGSRRGRDSVLTVLTPGEMVLNERQQAMLGGSSELARRLGIPRFAGGGEVKKPKGGRYGTFYLGEFGRFESPSLKGAHIYNPTTKRRALLEDRHVWPGPGTPHVGPTGDKMRGHWLQFPMWEKWFGPGQGEKFMREYAKRNRVGPAKFAKRWAEKHHLASRLLGIDPKKLAKLEHWPWWSPPEPQTGGASTGPIVPPLGGSAKTRYEKAVRTKRYADYLAGLGLPYVWGGGHGGWDYNGPFDCSGFVSHVLHFGLGMLGSPQTTYGLMPGLNGLAGGGGKWVTVYTKGRSNPRDAHTVISVLGTLYETGGQVGGTGRTSRSVAGFTPSHPPGYVGGGIGTGVLSLVAPGELVLTAEDQAKLGGRGRLSRLFGFLRGGTLGAFASGGLVADPKQWKEKEHWPWSIENEAAKTAYEPKIPTGYAFRWGGFYWGQSFGHGEMAFKLWAAAHGYTEEKYKKWKKDNARLAKILTTTSAHPPSGSTGPGPAPTEPEPEEPIEPEFPVEPELPDDGGTGGGDGGGDSGGPSPEEIAKQIQEAIAAEAAAIWGARSRFLSEFAPNIFSPGPEGLTMGSTPLKKAGGGVVVNQYFNRPPSSPFADLERARFAAQSALGRT